jgi:NAD(P)-dependent dehydrogenase (short-subunit alcohol dehydrogenase family)
MSPYSQDTTGEQVAEDLKANIAGKTILVTGTTPKGLGAAFAAIIARHHPQCIILATRDLAKAQEAAEDVVAAGPSVRVRCVELDLSSMQQVRKAAAEIKSFGEKIDVIVNNAGIMATPYAKTVDGLERQFGTNHIGHFLLTNLLLTDMLARGAPLRVINVSSNGFRFGGVRFGDHTFDVRTYQLNQAWETKLS